MPSGVVIAEALSGKLLFGNLQTERIFGRPFLPTASVEEYRDWNIQHLDGRPYDPKETPLARSLREGATIAGKELRITRGDSSLGVVRVNSAPIRDGEGRIVAAVVAFDDITEEKRAQEALRESGCQPDHQCLEVLTG